MSPIVASLLWSGIALSASVSIYGVARLIQPAKRIKPVENVDTLFRRKTCSNCRHSEISTVHPELACPIQGKHVEPQHQCEVWA